MRDRTRPMPRLNEDPDDVPVCQGNNVIAETRKAVETMLRIGDHNSLIRSSAGSHSVMEGGGMPYPAHRPQAPSASQSSAGNMVYGDGNTVTEGDIVLDERQMLAEVKTVAGNGVVLDVPSVGVRVVQPSDLLRYKKMGGKK